MDEYLITNYIKWEEKGYADINYVCENCDTENTKRRPLNAKGDIEKVITAESCDNCKESAVVYLYRGHDDAFLNLCTEFDPFKLYRDYRDVVPLSKLQIPKIIKMYRGMAKGAGSEEERIHAIRGALRFRSILKRNCAYYCSTKDNLRIPVIPYIPRSSKLQYGKEAGITNGNK